MPLHGQSTLVEWPLNTSFDLNPDNYNAAVLEPTDLQRGNGIGSIQVDADGAKARSWYPDPEIGIVDYYEVCITPKLGVTLHIEALEFAEHTEVNGVLGLEVRSSTNGFEQSSLLGTVVIPPNDTDVRSHNFDNLDIRICENSQLCFRIYGYGASDQNALWNIEKESLKIKGTVMPLCTAPSTQGTVGFSNVSPNSMTVNVTNGNGNARLIVMSKGSAVTSMPCSGFDYPASASFGSGYEIGMDEYVVYSGSATNGNSTIVTVNNLEEGANYHVAAFEYNSGSDCYKKINPARNSTVTTCQAPTKPINPMASPSSAGISLGWNNPFCFDQVLVVASTSPITGAPDGMASNFTTSTTFGNGTFTGTTFPPNVYPIYLGSNGLVDVVGLTPYTTYYFKFFTLLGSNWSAGVEISAPSAPGCADLGGNDVVFINEVHYANFGDDIDEGIEIAGAAGTNLSPYQLHLYEPKPYSLTKGIPYKTVNLSGVIDNESGGMGAVWFAIPNMEDYTGGIVLYNTVRKLVVQFLSYRQVLTAEGGIADGMISVTMKKANNSVARELNDPAFPSGTSMQLVGAGICPSDFDWVEKATATRGVLNDQQAVLPIELLDFSASVVDKEVLLKWITATEINNDYMAVERSADGRNFTEIGWLQGAGTTYEPQSYALWDKKPLSGINYYRLRQVDFDGTTVYHKVISVNMHGGDLVTSIYPTVAEQELTVVYGGPLPSNGQVDIVDLNGRVVFHRELNEGDASMLLPVGNLHSGHYFVRIEYQNESVIKRFLKM
ncbi:MAG: hypothetical protein DHS20C18_48000 [Saprospiraceae bacterium]|nr:MAG: hypothetical protein DHS20C18_48000 [Saprospiraceae bacterium]